MSLDAALDRVTVRDDAGRAVLERVTLSVVRGEAIALCGHNGGGKTTVLRLLAAMSQPTLGRVVVGGRDLSRLSYKELREHRTRVGLVFEAGGLWANRSVRDNIALPLRYHAGRVPDLDLRVRSLAEELDVVDELDLPSHRVNASVRKRALVARALALDPALLLCDEPQLGLVATEARRVARAIERRRKERGMTVVYADHDGLLDPYVVTRMVYFENGHVFDRPSALPPPDRPSFVGVLPQALGGAHVLGGGA
ncbi:MAG: ATP-binding cassette domain-containing protein [Polyangiaceae bacterium]|nr:ATP-binding cassette domain-containing protein [Polyangiaceae bacterium]